MSPGSEPGSWGNRRNLSNGIDLKLDLTDEMVAWWEDRFGPHNLLPRDICEFLVRDIPFEKKFTLTGINLQNGNVSFEIQAMDSVGDVILTGRSIEFGERQVHLNMTEVRVDAQGRGYGTLLARNCYRLARNLELDRLGVTALSGGSYAWARAGFLPTSESWNSDRCKQRIAAHMSNIPELDWTSKNNVYTMLGADERDTLWDIADLEAEVRSLRLPDEVISLGRALLAESGASWKGTMEFYPEDAPTPDEYARNEALQQEQLERARDYLGLKDDE